MNEDENIMERVRIAREQGDPEIVRIDQKWADFDTRSVCTKIDGKWSFDGFIQGMMYRNELMRAVDPSIGPLPPRCYDPVQIVQFLRLKINRPIWNGKELWFNDSLVKRFTKPAPIQKGLLDEFDALGWPQEIQNPFRSEASFSPASNEALRNAVDGLNNDQCDAKIVFRTRQQYDFASWEALPK